MANFARRFIIPISLAVLLAGCDSDKSPAAVQTSGVRDSMRVADLQQIETALELYFADNNAYPPGRAVVLGGGLAQILSSAGFTGTSEANGTTYMGQVPQNPVPGGVPYTYTQVGSGSYTIEFFLEGTWSCVLSSGLHILSPSGIADITID